MAQSGKAKPLRLKHGASVKNRSSRPLKNPLHPQRLCGKGAEIDLSRRALIMGILNVTPDSFSDGGRFLEPDHAVRHAKEMAAAGADIIDVGGESTRPGSEPVSLEEELRRVVPVIERLSREISIPISVDTYKAEVARRALQAGARWINDVSALRFDPKMAGLAAESRAPVVLMHMKGTPKNMQREPHYDSAVDEIYSFLEERIEFAVSAGIEREQIIIDPGIGFGKRTQDNLAILAGLERFTAFGRPVLIGTSRKSFIGRVLDLPSGDRLDDRLDNRSGGTAATLAIGLMKGARIFRVHDVAHAVRVVRMAEAVLHEELKG